MPRSATSSPTVIVRTGGDRPWPPRRILVPTTGTAASRRAAEIAFLLATEPGEEVVVLAVARPSEPTPAVVVEPGGIPSRVARAFGKLVPGRPTPPDPSVPVVPDAEHRGVEARRQIAEALAERGRAGGATFRAVVKVGVAEAVIVETALRNGVDLIVMGTDVKPGTDLLFLGPRVERILRDALCPVLVVNAS